MALPNSKKKRVVSSKSTSRTVTKDLEPLDPDTRDAILNDILRSDAKLPDYNFIGVRAQETIRIADKHNVGKMQVAGVRSALAKGIYDEYL